MHDIDHGGVLERFEHDALIYRDHEDFLAGTVPFVTEGIEAGQPVLVAVPATRLDLLRRALGPAAEQVVFADMQALGANPGRIIPAWADFVDGHPGPARCIGEPVWAGRTPEQMVECVHHEALLNLAFADAAEFRLLCPYDATTLPDHVIDGVDGTHRHVRRDEERRHSVRFPTHAPIPLAAPEALPAAPAGAVAWDFSGRELRHVRERVRQVGGAAGLPPTAIEDLALAAHEIAANSVEHGGGRGTIRTWLGEWSLIVEVRDTGYIADPLVGRRQPVPQRIGGRGLWMAQQLVDLLQLRTSPAGGTAIRLHRSTQQ
jgi:anti-sigma regulatory factor (Ser/Thr protein kinase)